MSGYHSNLKKGNEKDAVDGSIMLMQLLQNILAQVAPDGPESKGKKINIDYSGKDQPINVRTSGASAVFGNPWTVKGVLKRKKEDLVEYNMKFEFTAGGDNKLLWELSGGLGVKKLEPLKNSMSLEGWKIFKIGPYSKKSRSGTIYDYGARELESGVPTIGILREDLVAAKKIPD